MINHSQNDIKDVFYSGFLLNLAATYEHKRLNGEESFWTSIGKFWKKNRPPVPKKHNI